MKEKEIDLYLRFALEIAQLSHAKRLKVGAVLAKPDGIILSYGYNGTPSGMDNCCEDSSGKTKPEVIHAEMNAILKCAKEGISTKDSYLFLTHSPCMECAKLILQSGIRTVYYLFDYRDSKGIDFLCENSLIVQKKSIFKEEIT